MNLAERVRFAMKLRGATPAKLARACGRSSTAISLILSGQTKSLKGATATKMATFLKVNARWLTEGIGAVENGDLQGDNFGPGPEIQRTVPLISWVQAGPYTLAEDPEDVSACPRIETTMRAGDRAFALRVENDSMSPEFPPGTIIIVDPDLSANPGNFVIVANGAAEATFKQLVRDGDAFMLRPVNPQYPVRPMPEHARIVGVVVSAERRLV